MSIESFDINIVPHDSIDTRGGQPGPAVSVGAEPAGHRRRRRVTATATDRR